MVARNLSYGLPALALFPGNVTRHLCNTKRCCNPEHLATGNQRDNAQDARQSGTLPIGERHGHAILTDEIVKAIRRAAAAGVRQNQLADRYSVSPMAISDVVRRRTWRHLP